MTGLDEVLEELNACIRDYTWTPEERRFIIRMYQTPTPTTNECKRIVGLHHRLQEENSNAYQERIQEIISKNQAREKLKKQIDRQEDDVFDEEL